MMGISSSFGCMKSSVDPSDVQSSEEAIDITSALDMESSLRLLRRETELPRAGVSLSLLPVILSMYILYTYVASTLQSLNLLEVMKSLLSMFLGNFDGGWDIE